jgi:DNA-binding PadR family transcriptional regulator
MSLGHVLLGVLAGGPAHGYDLKRAHDARFPSVKPLAYGQVYTALSKMERDGLVAIAATTRDGGPDRTTYAVTPSGMATLREWLSRQEPAGPYAADDLVRKTVTALRLGADAAAFLTRQRAVHLARMRDLLTQQRGTDAIDIRIVIDHTIFHLDADLRWMEAAAARVASKGTVA